MKRPVTILALIAAAATPAVAQTDSLLARGIRAYQNLDIEQARAMFEQVLSPTLQFQVTEPQRATAQLYLGATMATLGQRDQALQYFVGAIQRNPLADLDPQRFTEQERAVFADAKLRTFRIGMRPIPRDTIEPRGRINLTIATTHGGTVAVELVSATTDDRYPVFAEDSLAGTREVPLTGLTRTGEFIPPGAYDLVVRGQSRLTGEQNETSILVELVHIRDTLLDTLQSLTEDQLRPERQPPSAAVRDLLNGFGIGAAALTSSILVGRTDLEEGRTLSAAMAIIGLGAGVYAYTKRRGNPVIPENIEWNNQQRRLRTQLNERIMQGNRERIAQTRLALRPLAQ